MPCNSKVSDDNLVKLAWVRRSKEYILWLDVSMADVLSVQVCNSLEHSLHTDGCIVFAEMVKLHNPIEQLSA